MKKRSRRGVLTRVLVIDDNQLSRKYCVAALEPMRCKLREAETGQNGIRVAANWLPDTILLDMELPDLDGFDVARRVRARWPAGRTRPRIIMLSADPPRSGENPGSANLIDGYLLKPVDPAALRGAVTGKSHSDTAVPIPGAVRATLHELFQRELAGQLETLDIGFDRGDLTDVRRVLHQMIAASAMCHQHDLEQDLRRLQTHCRSGSVASVASAYSAVLLSARHYLA